MAKHTILIAVTVDDKYSAKDVASEIVYFLPYITSECLDTVDSVITARMKQQAKTYQVWCAQHVAMYADVSAETHEQLLAAEESEGFSYSSFITTDDIEAVVNAVNNEFNGDLLYHEVSNG